jgi:hypothetical protein
LRPAVVAAASATGAGGRSRFIRATRSAQFPELGEVSTPAPFECPVLPTTGHCRWHKRQPSNRPTYRTIGAIAVTAAPRPANDTSVTGK